MENQKLLEDLNKEGLDVFTNSITETITAIAMLNSLVMDLYGGGYVDGNPPVFPFKLENSICNLQRLNDVLKSAKSKNNLKQEIDEALKDLQDLKVFVSDRKKYTKKEVLG